MQRLALGMIAAAVLVAAIQLGTTSPAQAAIHEIAAAYCSGGDVGTIGGDGFLEPPGITGGSNANNFARPVLASGAVAVPALTVTDHPSAKFTEGSNALALTGNDVEHASAEHCPGAATLP